MDISNIFPWCDNWWFEANRVWFIIGARNILCCFNLNSHECEVMVSIPDVLSTRFRAVSKCMKYQDEVYCFPIYGNSIWVYSIEGGFFSEIIMGQFHEECPEIHDFWEYNGKIFAVSIGWKQMLIINTEEKRIEDYYGICKEGGIARSVKAGTVIYSVSNISEKIYGFNLITREVAVYDLPRIGRKYNTICFDGANFCLSGYREEIYIWNKERNTINIYPCIPKGTYKCNFKKNICNGAENILEENEMPVFLYSVMVGKYSWFIPFQMGEILYMDRENQQIFMFEIECEESFLYEGELKGKYILEYVKDNRYLGLFSIKNNQIVEIDTEKLTCRWCDYQFGDNSIKKYAELVDFSLYESNVWDREVYKKMIKQGNDAMRNSKSGTAGMDIYREMIM